MYEHVFWLLNSLCKCLSTQNDRTYAPCTLIVLLQYSHGPIEFNQVYNDY